MIVLGLARGRERREPAQVAEHHHDLHAPPLEHAVVARPVDEFRHLGREEAPETVDALLPLLRQGQLARHRVEAGRQPPQFVPGRDRDAVIEMARADLLGPVLELPDRVRSCAGQPKGEQRPRRRRRGGAGRPSATGRRRSGRRPRPGADARSRSSRRPGTRAMAAMTAAPEASWPIADPPRPNGVAQQPERARRRIVTAAQHQADVGMRDQPALPSSTRPCRPARHGSPRSPPRSA